MSERVVYRTLTCTKRYMHRRPARVTKPRKREKGGREQLGWPVIPSCLLCRNVQGQHVFLANELAITTKWWQHIKSVKLFLVECDFNSEFPTLLTMYLHFVGPQLDSNFLQSYISFFFYLSTPDRWGAKKRQKHRLAVFSIFAHFSV